MFFDILLFIYFCNPPLPAPYSISLFLFAFYIFDIIIYFFKQYSKYNHRTKIEHTKAGEVGITFPAHPYVYL